jgi:hypothetical protein
MTECQGRHFGISPEFARWQFGGDHEMLVIRDETPRDVGQVRMINMAAYDQPDEAFMIRILDPAASPATGRSSTQSFDGLVPKLGEPWWSTTWRERADLAETR